MSTALVGAPVVVALIGQLAVAVAAVVVVLAIIAVIVMVLRNNGAARQAAGGLGYDAGRGARDDYDDSYDNAPAPWARQGGAPQQANAWQNGGGNGYSGPNGGGNFGGPGGQSGQSARNSGPNWGPGDQQSAPAWGGPPAASEAARGWGNQQPAPAMNGMPRGQAQQNPWDAPDVGMPWGDNQGGNQGGNQVGPGGQGWGQPAAQAAAPWGAPPVAAPEQNAWGIAAPTSGGQQGAQQNAWGPPPAAPHQNAWGAGPTPSGPNWGSPPPMPNAPPTQPWGGPGGPGGYDAPPPQQYGGMGAQERGRPGTNLRPGAIMVKEGKEPGRVFEIRGDRLTIGRSRDSDIFLEDLAVSRLHATVYREPTGLYVVRDENSANGTTVNGQRITEQPLEEGDEIGLGQTILTFVRR
jgi:hypothetical protein